MLMRKCLPVGGGWRDDAAGDGGTGGIMQAAQGRCEEGRSRMCDRGAKELRRVDLGLYEIVSMGVSIAYWLKPGIDFDIDLEVMLFVQIAYRVSRIATVQQIAVFTQQRTRQWPISLFIGEGSQKKDSDSANAHQLV